MRYDIQKCEKALGDMPMKSWDILKYILRYIGAVIHFKVNINEEACS
jgi:hypothetical protein